MIIKKKNPSRRHSSKSRNDSRAFGKVLSRSCTKTLFPVSVKLDEKVVFCLPTAGGRTQFYHFIFTQPGKSLLVQPCILLVRFLLCRVANSLHTFNAAFRNAAQIKSTSLCLSVCPSFHSIATDFRCHRVDVTFKGRGRFKPSLIRIRRLYLESHIMHGLKKDPDKDVIN